MRAGAGAGRRAFTTAFSTSSLRSRNSHASVAVSHASASAPSAVRSRANACDQGEHTAAQHRRALTHLVDRLRLKRVKAQRALRQLLLRQRRGCNVARDGGRERRAPASAFARQRRRRPHLARRHAAAVRRRPSAACPSAARKSEHSAARRAALTCQRRRCRSAKYGKRAVQWALYRATG